MAASGNRSQLAKSLARISALEKELQEREKELALLKSELSSTATKVQSLVEQLREQVQASRAIHRALVPTSIPKVGNFEISFSFMPSAYSMGSGGDYFFIDEQVSPHQFALIMSSATSYGVSAVLLEAFFKFKSTYQKPKDFLENILHYTVTTLGSLDPEDVNIFYAHVHTLDLHIQAAQKGFNMGFFWPHADARRKPQALFKTPQLSLCERSLSAQDQLWLCSPGVFQAKGESGQSWSPEEFGNALRRSTKALQQADNNGGDTSIHALRHHMVLSLKSFLGPDAKIDLDQSMLVCAVKRQVLKLQKP